MIGRKRLSDPSQNLIFNALSIGIQYTLSFQGLFPIDFDRKQPFLGTLVLNLNLAPRLIRILRIK